MTCQEGARGRGGGGVCLQTGGNSTGTRTANSSPTGNWTSVDHPLPRGWVFGTQGEGSVWVQGANLAAVIPEEREESMGEKKCDHV